ncbi:MAG: hypothetical protein M1834_006229 [Cirrosporium novae-zelandiae]|nr:MAG: hypothetical protein M1834_006229 [Cirrosporium novae-zelandiae]
MSPIKPKPKLKISPTIIKPATLFAALSSSSSTSQPYTLNRTFTFTPTSPSHHPQSEFPSSLLGASARFIPFPSPTNPNPNPNQGKEKEEKELLYEEQGKLKLLVGAGNQEVPVWKRYLWRLVVPGSGGDGGLEVWFVKPGSDSDSGVGGDEKWEAEKIFHVLDFGDGDLNSDADIDTDTDTSSNEEYKEEQEQEKEKTTTTTHLLKAHATHLCEKDLYTSLYRFWITVPVLDAPSKEEGEERGKKGVEVRKWDVRHWVKGPRKDGVIWSRYFL